MARFWCSSTLAHGMIVHWLASQPTSALSYHGLNAGNKNPFRAVSVWNISLHSFVYVLLFYEFVHLQIVLYNLGILNCIADSCAFCRSHSTSYAICRSCNQSLDQATLCHAIYRMRNCVYMICHGMANYTVLSFVWIQLVHNKICCLKFFTIKYFQWASRPINTQSHNETSFFCENVNLWYLFYRELKRQYYQNILMGKVQHFHRQTQNFNGQIVHVFVLSTCLLGQIRYTLENIFSWAKYNICMGA